MKLRETLTKQQTIDLLEGNVVGIFPSMVLQDDVFYGKLYELCLGYYTARSGEKTISLTYERFISLVKDNPEIRKTPEELIGTLIRGKFLDKWNRVYDVLITSQYDALNNREYTEEKTGNNQNRDTHNTTKAKQGNNTDVMTYDTESGRTGNNTDVTTFDTNVEDNGKTGTSEVTTRNVTDDNNVYGFNSPTPVGDTNSIESTSETIVGEADKNTSYNLQTKTGTESKEFGVDETVTKTGTDSRAIGIDESETHTGTDTTDITIDEKVVRNGRDGSGAELITEELNLRNTQLFFDIIYADIDSIATLQIYI